MATSSRPFLILTSAALLLLLSPLPAPAQNIGETRWIDGPTFDVEVGWDESDQSSQPWQLDSGWNGWAVVKYEISRSVDRGNASVSVGYLAGGGQFVSAAEVDKMYRDLIDLAVKYNNAEYRGRLEQERAQQLSVYQSFSSTHRGIVVTARARGSGDWWDRWGSHIRGKVRVQLVYLGTPQALNLIRDRHVLALTGGSGPTGPTNPGGLRTGEVRLNNNYGGQVTIHLYHPAAPNRVFARWVLAPSQQTFLVHGGRRVVIGGDWGIDILFGNGVRSPKRPVQRIGAHSGSVWSIDASRIYLGR